MIVDMEMIKIKNNAKTDKIRLDKDNIRMCIWVCFKLGSCRNAFGGTGTCS